jgi:hypothetical protein
MDVKLEEQRKHRLKQRKKRRLHRQLKQAKQKALKSTMKIHFGPYKNSDKFARELI